MDNEFSLQKIIPPGLKAHSPDIYNFLSVGIRHTTHTIGAGLIIKGIGVPEHWRLQRSDFLLPFLTKG